MTVTFKTDLAREIRDAPARTFPLLPMQKVYGRLSGGCLL